MAREPLLLSVENLTSRFFLPTGVVHAVERVSFDLRPGESLGIVGESGSGKTATVMSLLRLLPAPGRIVGGRVTFEERELLELEEEEIRRIRGVRMALIPQNPGSALNPVLTIGWQLREALETHRDLSRSEAEERIVEGLHLAGIPEPARQLERYPHEFSGGMKQRILIAMGVLNHPALLIADEPTTALDTTTQAKVLELMSDLVDSFGMALLIITHNMGVIASVCDRVAVMYDGRDRRRRLGRRPLPGTAAPVHGSPAQVDAAARSTANGAGGPRGAAEHVGRGADRLRLSRALSDRRGEMRGSPTDRPGRRDALGPVLGGAERDARAFGRRSGSS